VYFRKVCEEDIKSFLHKELKYDKFSLIWLEERCCPIRGMAKQV